MSAPAVEAERPLTADSGGISAVVPLALLADHPESPRSGLGDLAELAASIRSQGLFEPLIVLTAAGGDRCPVRYDRDNEKPGRECAWDCARHKTTRGDDDGRAEPDPDPEAEQ